ncbi:MAG: prolyl oligopeptidase family serine peptidase [Acetobacteraceae bacterium]
MSTLDGPRLDPAAGGEVRQLVVLCHGVGADGHDLIGLAPAWSHAVPSAAFVAPSAPEHYDQDPHGSGRQWFSVADRTPSVMARGARAAAALLGSFIDAELERLALPATAYALMGFSQGAMTVLFTGLRRLAAPRAILAYSGALLAPETLESELRNHAPVLLVHGEADDVVPVVRSRDAERDLRAAGVRVEAHYTPGLGHGIDEDGIRRGGVFLRRAFGEE